VRLDDLVARAVAGLVGASLRHARVVVALFAALTVAAGWISVTRFQLNSDVTQLFPQDLPWRLNERAMDVSFPDRIDVTAVVIDAPTGAAANRTAEAMAEALRAQPQVFRNVRRPDAGPFFDRHAALFLSLDEVRDLTERLIEAQPLLGTLAADPSLRGVAELLRSAMEGVNRGDARLDQLAGPLRAFGQAAEAALAGRVAEPDWTLMMTGRAASALETRRFVLAQPVLNFSELEAGHSATEAIQEAAARLAAPGIRIRITGNIPMADEEFATLSEGAVENVTLSLGMTVLLLWLALHSWRLILPLMVLVVAGLAWTAAFGVLAVGHFNPLSIAFAVLFIGLGVDFGIQYAVQYRAERRAAGALAPALLAAARVAGPGMTLAAMACALSFLSFVPTDYLGVRELGLIAGMGMLIGWLMAMTLLPALMLLARPSAEAHEVGYPFLVPLDRWLLKHARWLLGLGLVTALACLVALPRLSFDSDPLNLRDPTKESVATYRELMLSAETNPNSLDILVADLPAAVALAARLEALPEVGRALTLASFVPEGQAEKLALLEDAASLLAPAFGTPRGAGPTDAAAAAALARAGLALRTAQGEAPAARDARRLGAAFVALASAPPAARQALATALLPGLLATLGQVEGLLAAGPVTLESLPEELRADWIGRDGRVRVEVAPRVLGQNAPGLRDFAAAVQRVAPDATGAVISTAASAATVLEAFVVAGVIALVLVMALLLVHLRSIRLSLLALAPLGLAGLMTLAHCAMFGPDLNLANIIALPLLVGLGVAYDIYYVAAWVRGERHLLASAMNRGVMFSAVTNAAAFGALAVSPHPGTASMGVLLFVSLAYKLVCVMVLLPALLRVFAPGGQR
jgi:hopanoid biosynthesis associated RND transporter like protein HpnN